MEGFHRLSLERPPAFEALLRAAALADVTSGRAGNHLTWPSEAGVPIVRTTTAYPQAQGRFGPEHQDIVAQVQRAAEAQGLPKPSFNHALVELYDQRYRKMGYHCDQALDLAEGSFIAIASIYDRDPGTGGPGLRQLMVQRKEGEGRATLPMPQGSVLLFSVETNAQHRHKIVLPSPAAQETRWLGLTLRCSKTFVRHSGGATTFADGRPLQLADEHQRRDFFRMRGQENRERGFRYPALPYTLSEGDLMPLEPERAGR